LVSERSQIPSEYERFQDTILGQESQYAKEERILQENGLYTLDGFLSYWVKTNNEILAKVPNSRILVVRTDEIDSKRNEIADFLNISSKTLDMTKSHMNKSAECPNILFKIDKDYLKAKVNLHAKDLMDKFFPGFIYNSKSPAKR
jgi:hypothetical protein